MASGLVTDDQWIRFEEGPCPLARDHGPPLRGLVCGRALFRRFFIRVPPSIRGSAARLYGRSATIALAVIDLESQHPSRRIAPR